MSVYQRLRWWLRRIIPITITDRQAAILNAVTIHLNISGADGRDLLDHIGPQLDATPHDMRVVAWLIGADR